MADPTPAAPAAITPELVAQIAAAVAAATAPKVAVVETVDVTIEHVDFFFYVNADGEHATATRGETIALTLDQYDRHEKQGHFAPRAKTALIKDQPMAPGVEPAER